MERSSLFQMFYLSSSDWSLCKYTMTSPRFSKVLKSVFRVELFYPSALKTLIILLMLEVSPLANVALSVPPVPVFNCEPLNGPGPRWRKSSVPGGRARGLPASLEKSSETNAGLSRSCIVISTHANEVKRTWWLLFRASGAELFALWLWRV